MHEGELSFLRAGAARMKSIFAAILLAAAAALFPPVVGHAFEIQFDESTTEDGGNKKVLRGNVVIELGGMRLQADKVVQHLEEDAPVKYEATGDPVLLKPTDGVLEGLDSGTAETLAYLVPEKTLLLTNYELRLDNGSVQRGKSMKLVLEK